MALAPITSCTSLPLPLFSRGKLLSDLCTWGIGGPAKLFCQVRHESHLLSAIRLFPSLSYLQILPFLSISAHFYYSCWFSQQLLSRARHSLPCDWQGLQFIVRWQGLWWLHHPQSHFLPRDTPNWCISCGEWVSIQHLRYAVLPWWLLWAWICFGHPRYSWRCSLHECWCQWAGDSTTYIWIPSVCILLDGCASIYLESRTSFFCVIIRLLETFGDLVMYTMMSP